jgi:hypothetical protein
MIPECVAPGQPHRPGPSGLPDPATGRLGCSADDAARLTGLSRDLLDDQIRRGDLAGIKVGRCRFITRHHLQQFPGHASRNTASACVPTADSQPRGTRRAGERGSPVSHVTGRPQPPPLAWALVRFIGTGEITPALKTELRRHTRSASYPHQPQAARLVQYSTGRGATPGRPDAHRPPQPRRARPHPGQAGRAGHRQMPDHHRGPPRPAPPDCQPHPGRRRHRRHRHVRRRRPRRRARGPRPRRRALRPEPTRRAPTADATIRPSPPSRPGVPRLRAIETPPTR